MLYNNLGNSDMLISRIGLGTLHHGVYVGLKESERLINKAIDLGINFIETAPIYGKGHSESLVGKNIKHFRSEIFLSTKVGLVQDTLPSGDFGVKNQVLSKQNIKASVENSLKSLQSDYIDLLQLHAFDSSTPIEETFEVLEELRKEGKIKYFGCSNYSPSELNIALQLNNPFFVSCQAHYNIVERFVEEKLLPICSEKKMGVIFNRVLARGTLSNKYLNGSIPSQSRAYSSNRIQKLLEPEFLSMIEVLQQWAKEKQMSVIQCGLSWIISRPLSNCALIGVRSEEQLVECIKSIEFPISLKEWEELDEIFENNHWLAEILKKPKVYLEK